MKKDKNKTQVIFRKWKQKSIGDNILALFPNELYNTDLYGDSMVMSYEHIGQHSGADYTYCISATRPATKAEYKALYRELTGLGYNLEVKLKRTYRKGNTK